MQSLPGFRMMRRVLEDIERCVDFVRRQPWGRPADRERDIYLALQRIREAPERRPVEARRQGGGIELRRCRAGSFVVVYAYFRPDARFPRGVVSIRAIRHRRERNVFAGVRQPTAPPYSTTHMADGP